LRNEIPLTLEEVTFCLNGANGLVFEDDRRAGIDEDESESWMVDRASSEDSRIVLNGKRPEKRKDTIFSPKPQVSREGVVPMDYYRHSVGVGKKDLQDGGKAEQQIPNDDKERNTREPRNGRLAKRPPQTHQNEKFKLKTVPEDELPRFQTPPEIFSRPSFSISISGDTTPVNHESCDSPAGRGGKVDNDRGRWDFVVTVEKERAQNEKAKEQMRWWRRLRRMLMRMHRDK
jgi:hypothetical protein